MSVISRLGIAVVLLLAVSGAARAQWKTLNNPFGTTTHLDTCVLLTNGDVMCHEYGTANWHRRRPDNTGSYLNGKWDNPSIASMPNGTDASNVSGLTCAPCAYAPTYFASQVLPNGKVVVLGGEYNAQDGNTAVDTNIGFLYDPDTDKWSTQLTTAFGTGCAGDNASVVTEAGIMLVASICNGNLASFDPATLTFTALNPSGKVSGDSNDEEGWTNLPGNKVLTVDANTANSFEIYSVASNSWGNDGTTVGIALTDLGSPSASPQTGCNSHEVGPAVLRQDGTLIYFSGSIFGQNAVYNINTGTFSNTSSMNFPSLSSAQYGAADAPASLLPDGHVLVMASPVTCNGPNSKGKYSIFNSPSHFFEWDGTNLSQVSDSANASAFDSYQGRMLLLPTGEVLLTAYDQGSNDAQQLYRNGNPQLTGYGPVILDFPPNYLGLGTTYSIGGTHFNGFSQGAFYGDDSQSSTNYPLVRITDSASHVFYAKTHGHSRMGVQAPSDNATVTTTNFDVPAGMATGAASLVVVTNGFPSTSYTVNIAPGTTLTYTGATTGDYNDSVTLSVKLTSAGSPIGGAAIAITNTFGGGTCILITDSNGNAACTATPSAAAGTSYTVTATFAGNSSYGASSATVNFTVTLEDSHLAITGPTTSDFNDAVTVKAQLTDPDDATAIPGKSVKFVLGSGAGTETCFATTDGLGNATCSITPIQAAGPYTLTTTFTDNVYYKSATASVPFTITLEESSLAITGPTTSDYHDAVSVKAQLTDPDDATPVTGKTVKFVLGSGAGTETCSAATDALGNATCSITPNQAAGPYTLTATFTDGVFYKTATASTSFTVTLEETTLAFTAASATVTSFGSPAIFSATLLEDGTTAPIPFGQTITFTLGPKAQTCSGTVTVSGFVTCTIPAVLQSGPMLVTATFAGDPYYLSATASEVVNPAPTYIAAACGTAAIPYGDNYNCAVSVGSTIGAAVGSITYTYDANPAVSLTLSNGLAQVTLPVPALGPHALVFAYAKQGFFKAAPPDTQNFTVTQALTQVVVTPSSYLPAAGASVTLSASVTSYSAAPPGSGTVTFFDNGALIGSGPVNALGQASLVIPAIAAGTHFYTARFGGFPPDYAAGVSAEVTVKAQ
jgi:hypothetical protein